MNLGLWDNDMKEDIMRANGSIQHIEAIPQELKELYKTVWEIKQKNIIDLSCEKTTTVYLHDVIEDDTVICVEDDKKQDIIDVSKSLHRKRKNTLNANLLNCT